MVPCPSTRDVVLWVPSASNTFSTASCWQSLRQTRNLVPWHKIVWFSASIPKASFILWLAIKGKLKTQDRLIQSSSQLSCLLCGSQMETHNHLFFSCSYTQEIWMSLLMKSEIPYTHHSWNEWVDWMTKNHSGKKFKDIVLKLCFGMAIHSIWMERNNRFHANSFKRPNEVLHAILELIRLRLTSLRKIHDTLENRSIQTSWGIPDTIF